MLLQVMSAHTRYCSDPDVLRWLYNHPHASTEAKVGCLQNYRCPEDVAHAGYLDADEDVRSAAFDVVEGPTNFDPAVRAWALSQESSHRVLYSTLSRLNADDDEVFVANPHMSSEVFDGLLEADVDILNALPRTFWKYIGRVPDNIWVSAAADRLRDPHCTSDQQSRIVELVTDQVVHSCQELLDRLGASPGMLHQDDEELDRLLRSVSEEASDGAVTELRRHPLCGFDPDVDLRTVLSTALGHGDCGQQTAVSELLALAHIGDRVRQVLSGYHTGGPTAAQWLLDNDLSLHKFSHDPLPELHGTDPKELIEVACTRGMFVVAGHLLVRYLTHSNLNRQNARFRHITLAARFTADVYKAWMGWTIEQHLNCEPLRPTTIELSWLHELISIEDPYVRETLQQGVTYGGSALLNSLISSGSDRDDPHEYTRVHQRLMVDYIYLLGPDVPLRWLLTGSGESTDVLGRTLMGLPEQTLRAVDVLASSWTGSLSTLVDAANTLLCPAPDL